MKNLNIEELNDISVEEQTIINGGCLVGILVAIGLYVMSDWDDISQGWEDAKAGKEYNYKR